MAQHAESNLNGWSAILLAPVALALTACIVRSEPRIEPDATVKLVRLREEGKTEAGATRIVGQFVLQNNSSRDLCVNQDIVENDFSPYLEVPAKAGRGRFKYTPGIPPPPMTAAVMRLPPGASVGFKRVVYYLGPDAQPVQVRLRLEAHPWWCESGRNLRLRSGSFSPTPFEPQS